MQPSWIPSSFIILYNKEIYNGITGIAELAWVTSALFTETYALPPIEAKLSVIVNAVAWDGL
jgi:hypothetical protein